MGQALKERETDVGTFVSGYVVADSRDGALKKARVETRRLGYTVRDVTQVTRQGYDEWFVELMVAR